MLLSGKWRRFFSVRQFEVFKAKWERRQPTRPVAAVWPPRLAGRIATDDHGNIANRSGPHLNSGGGGAGFGGDKYAACVIERQHQISGRFGIDQTVKLHGNVRPRSRPVLDKKRARHERSFGMEAIGCRLRPLIGDARKAIAATDGDGHFRFNCTTRSGFHFHGHTRRHKVAASPAPLVAGLEIADFDTAKLDRLRQLEVVAAAATFCTPVRKIRADGESGAGTRASD